MNTSVIPYELVLTPCEVPADGLGLTFLILALAELRAAGSDVSQGVANLVGHSPTARHMMCSRAKDVAVGV